MQRTHYSILIFIALFVALLAAVYPVQTQYAAFRPEWVCVVVIYWLLYRPEQLGVGRAWLIGLLQDIVEGGVWGGHALALAFVAYICLLSYRRLRSYPLYQQCMWVFILVGVHQIFVNWIQGLQGYDAPSGLLLISSAITALIWPMVVIMFQRIERRYRF